MKAQRAVRLAPEDPIEDERVEVHVQVEGAPEPLHARHHAGLPTGESRVAAIGRAQRPHEDVQHRATQPVIVGESVAEPVGDREHPLPHRHVGRENMIDQVRGALGHQPHSMMRGGLKSAR